LLLDRGRNRGCDRIDLDNGFADLSDPPGRFLGGGLDRGDLVRDLVGRPGGLGGEALDPEATTAKPLPASPARAASIVALRASRFVCLAMPLISFTTSPIFCAVSASILTALLVTPASSTALLAIFAD
jgi:hypothetical protein